MLKCLPSPHFFHLLLYYVCNVQEGPPTLETMDDMQCMWFQTELAHAYYRLGKLGDALQKLHEIDKVHVSVVKNCTLVGWLTQGGRGN